MFYFGDAVRSLRPLNVMKILNVIMEVHTSNMREVASVMLTNLRFPIPHQDSEWYSNVFDLRRYLKCDVGLGIGNHRNVTVNLNWTSGWAV